MNEYEERKLAEIISLDDFIISSSYKKEGESCNNYVGPSDDDDDMVVQIKWSEVSIMLYVIL